MTKVTVPLRGSKDERSLRCVWPLKLCYRGIVYHGAKWQRWKKTNPTGSMEEFWSFRERKMVRARAEIRAFWEQRYIVIGA